MHHVLVTLLAHMNDESHEQAVYYVSQLIIGVGHQCNLVEKECLTVLFVVQKMQYYLV